MDGDSEGAGEGVSAGLAYRQARMIVAAMALGVLLFYGVTLYFAGGPEPAKPMFSADTALVIWGAVAVAGLSVALVFRNKAASRAQEARGAGRGLEAADLGQVQSFVIIAAAMMEGPALLAGVMAFTSGDTRLLPWAAGMFALGFAIVFPRAEWYGVGERRG